MELVELLNKLIEKGWKPRWLKHKIFSVQRTPDNMIYFDWWFALERCYDFRRLTSKESGLWQFVCENMLFVIRTPLEEDYRWQHIECILNKPNRVYYKNDIDRWYDYQYRLIESALKDESELEKFLLDNIKV